MKTIKNAEARAQQRHIAKRELKIQELQAENAALRDDIVRLNDSRWQFIENCHVARGGGGNASGIE